MSDEESSCYRKASVASVGWTTDPEMAGRPTDGGVERSPLRNRLRQTTGTAAALDESDEATVQEQLPKLLKSLKVPDDPRLISAVLKCLTKELGDDCVKEGIKQHLSKTQLYKRSPSLAQQKRLKTVCVTGAGDFMASYIIEMFLKFGIGVVAVVNERTDKKVQFLYDLPCAKEHLKIVCSDFSDTSLDNILVNCDAVIHSAWPVRSKRTGEKAEKTLKMMNQIMFASARSPTTRHIILTSSTAAVRLFTNPTDPKRGFDGDSWSDAEKMKDAGMHEQLNVLQAERRGWELFAERLSYHSGKNIKISSICLGQVIGPPHDDKINPSCMQIGELLSGELEEIPLEYLQYVDVRDAAKAHFLVAQNCLPGRMCCVGGSVTYETLLKEMTQVEWVNVKVPSKMEEGSLPAPDKFDTDDLESLGLEFTPLRQTLADTLQFMKTKGWMNDEWVNSE